MKKTSVFKNISPLAKRMVIYVVLASTFITIFTSIFQLYEIYKTNVKGIEVRINEVRDSYGKNIASRLWVSNKNELDITLEGILRLPDIEYIEVYEGEELVAQQGRLPDSDTIDDNFPLHYYFQNKLQKIGRVHIVATLSNTYNYLYEQAITIIISNTIITFFITSFMLFLFYNLIVRHLITISHFTETLDINFLNNKLELHRKSNGEQPDEIDQLAHTLVRLQKRLKDSLEKLLQKETEQREILNSIMDGVITIDEHNKVLTFNNVSEKMFGYSVVEMIGENISKVIPEKYELKHSGGFVQYLKKNDESVLGVDGGIELDGRRKNGSFFPLRLLISELPLDMNGQRRFMGTCQDLTQLKQNEEQLRRSQKMDALGKLTGGIAHDYNNMLGVVLGYTELLQTMLREQPDLRAYADEIMKAGERGAKLTKKLLSFSRKQSSDPEVLDVNNVLHGEQHMLEKTLTARIKLDLALLQNELLVSVDAGEFEDAIINLSINAMHAIEGNGELIIKANEKILGSTEAKVLQIEPNMSL